MKSCAFKFLLCGKACGAFVVLIIFLPLFSFSEHATDSLLKVANGNGPDSARVDAFIKLSIRFNANDPSRALGFGRQALQLSLKSELKRRQSQSYSVIGNVFYIKSDYDSALYYYRLAQKIAGEGGFRRDEATAINNVGLVYINRGDYAKGLDNQFASLKIREEIHDSDGIAFNYNAIAVVYLQKGDKKNALQYQLRSLTIAQLKKNARGIMTNLGNIGNIYYEMGVYDKAIEYDLQSLAKARELNNLTGMANVYGNLGNIFTKEKLYSKAIEYYDLSISIQERLGDKDDRSSNYHSKADALRAMGEYAKSLDAEKLAYFFAKETQGREQLAVAYQGLALSYEALGDHANAFVNMQLYANLRDSINREENRRNVTEMQTRFDSENKEKQIALQDQQLKVQDLEDQRKNTVINFTIIGLVLMFLLALLLYNRFRIKQKANKELESAYQVIEEKNKSITDSIHYAKRIQESLLPTEKYIDKSLEKGKRKDEPSGHV